MKGLAKLACLFSLLEWLTRIKQLQLHHFLVAQYSLSLQELTVFAKLFAAFGKRSVFGGVVERAISALCDVRRSFEAALSFIVC